MTNHLASEPLFTLADGIETVYLYQYPDSTMALILYSNGTSELEITELKSGEVEKYLVTSITEIGDKRIVTGPYLDAVLS